MTSAHLVQGGNQQLCGRIQAEEPGPAVAHQDIADQAAVNSQAENCPQVIPMGQVLRILFRLRRHGDHLHGQLRRTHFRLIPRRQDFPFCLFVSAGQLKGKSCRFPVPEQVLLFRQG